MQPGLPPEPSGAGGVKAGLPTDVNNEITSADRMQLYATRQVKQTLIGQEMANFLPQSSGTMSATCALTLDFIYECGQPYMHHHRWHVCMACSSAPAGKRNVTCQWTLASVLIGATPVSQEC